MDIKYLEGQSYADVFDSVITLLRSRKTDTKVRHILFVPDKYTLYAEQRLYEGTPGAFDAEVLTLNRLFFRLCDGAKGEAYLPKQGAVLLTRRITNALADDLKCFARSAQFSGFAEKMYETMAQLMACRLNPDDLPKLKGALGLKLGDVKQIYSGYAKRTAGKYIDSGGRLELLYRELSKTDYFKNTVVYFANFDSMTKQTEDLVQKIAEKAKAAYITAPSFTSLTFSKAEVYEANDEVGCIKAAAKRILSDAYNGIGLNEICLVTPNPADGRIARIFTEYGIPFQSNKKHVLGDHPLARFIRLALTVADFPRRADVLALVRNPYLSVFPSEADLFENYCNQFLIDYEGFYTPFEKGRPEPNPHGAYSSADARVNYRINAAEQVRKKLAALIKPLKAALAGVTNAQTFAQSVQLTLLLCKAKLVTPSLTGLPDLGDVCGKIESALSLLLQVYGNAIHRADVFLDAFSETLDATEIAALPKLNNTVAIGAPDAFRGARFIKAYIVGFCEGVLPAVQKDGGIISDREIDALKEKGVDVRPKIAEVNERARQEVLSLFASAQSLFIGYSTEGGNKLSSLFHQFEHHFLSVKKNSESVERFIFNESSDPDFIAQQIASRANGRELLALGLYDSDAFPCKYLSEIHAAMGGAQKEPLVELCESHPDLGRAGQFFFASGSTTVSRIQEYFTCPYKHFLRYGLGVKPREDGELSPLDIGNFLHKVIEVFVSKGDYSHINEAVEQIVGQTAESEVKYRLKANDAVIRQISSEAKQIAHVVAAQIQGGSFLPMGQEIRFDGQEKQLKTLRLSGKDYSVALTGIIDRADRFKDYARVVDYKTGHTEFSFSDLYYGRKIQLPLYMRILAENGLKPGGMFYFPFSVRWGDDAFSHRLLGVFNSEPTLVTALDNSLSESDVKSEIIPAQTRCKPDKSGAPVLKKSKSALSTTDLEKISEYALQVLENGAKEIASGNIAPSPCREGDKRACDFCEVRCACNFSTLTGKERLLKKVESVEVIEAVRLQDEGNDDEEQES